ncbi:hypothetical protein PRIPAC_73924, partial [Pristionchus pacificus]|uniref:Uncharacterized protein n=1 Tax=Pristionchus pacificus TaxID=54126 RepID=A0A2A6CZR3_PRIPA
ATRRHRRASARDEDVVRATGPLLEAVGKDEGYVWSRRAVSSLFPLASSHLDFCQPTWTAGERRIVCRDERYVSPFLPPFLLLFVLFNGVNVEPGWEKRLLISAEAHLVFSVDATVDGAQDNSLAVTAKIGTTNRGIGPTYSSKCFRNGVRVTDLMEDLETFEDRYLRLVSYYRNQFPNIQVDEDAELAKFKLVGDSLGEGTNGALLDIDFVKAYQTRVGTGPFSTELFDDDGAKLQSIEQEVGVTTGRKRRCDWLDLFLLRRSAHINGYTHIALTKLDILDSSPNSRWLLDTRWTKFSWRFLLLKHRHGIR